MLPARSASLRDLAILGAVLSAVSVPMACAHGSGQVDIGIGGNSGNGGTGGQTVGHPVTVTATTGGFPTSSVTSTTGNPTTSTTTGGFPTSSSSSTTTGGFPTSSSISTTTSGFPTSSTTVGPGPTSTSSTGGSSACDTAGSTCSNCSTCADGSVCSMQSFVCQLDFDCSSILFCAGGCLDNACVNNCVQQYPNGQTFFNAYVNCLACSCVKACMIPAGSCP